MKNIYDYIICLIKGHDYGNEVYISPSMLTCCHRCGKDIQGRSIDDLEPMNDQDREYIENLSYEEIDK